MNDHASLRITPSLLEALQALMRSGAIYKPIWIDQICINQSDVEEKEAQVKLMPEIYGQAERTIGWLGPAADDSDAAMRFLDEFFESYLERGAQSHQDYCEERFRLIAAECDPRGRRALSHLV